MVTNSTFAYLDVDKQDSEDIWDTLYPSLQSLARYLVYALRIPVWRGQEEDMIEDIVQETARRLLERVRKAECGEAEPIDRKSTRLNSSHANISYAVFC